MFFFDLSLKQSMFKLLVASRAPCHLEIRDSLKDNVYLSSLPNSIGCVMPIEQGGVWERSICICALMRNICGLCIIEFKTYI